MISFATPTLVSLRGLILIFRQAPLSLLHIIIIVIMMMMMMMMMLMYIVNLYRSTFSVRHLRFY